LEVLSGAPGKSGLEHHTARGRPAPLADVGPQGACLRPHPARGATPARARRGPPAAMAAPVGPQLPTPGPAAPPGAGPGQKDPYGREVLWRKLRRAALRRQHSIQVADSDGEGGVSRKAKRKGSDKPRSRSRKKKRSKSSSSSSMGVAGRMQAAIRPNAMPMKTLGMAAYADMTTGGFGMLPSGYSNATGSMDGAKTCMKYLAGCCPLGTSCPNNHPSDPADMARWIQYFNKLPCKSGANCTNDKCLYEHPNKPTWNGVYHAAGGTSL
ncbi:unnamed protein product, partial [Prorocentrum cordatum]